tara:strand:- start:612 stop:974 length:363 start_codon:yes stop_codon:yes gene_type:complete
MKINDVLNEIDEIELGEILMDKAESILYSDYNIIVLKIEYEDLKSENFENMQEIGSVEYGDWESLKNFVSESEVERIKNQFDEDFNDFMEDEDSEIDDCLQIYTSLLYCNGEFVWSGMTT